VKAIEPENLKIYANPTVYHGFAVFVEDLKTGKKLMLESHAGHDAAIKAAKELDFQVKQKKVYIRM